MFWPKNKRTRDENDTTDRLWFRRSSVSATFPYPIVALPCVRLPVPLPRLASPAISRLFCPSARRFSGSFPCTARSFHSYCFGFSSGALAIGPRVFRKTNMKCTQSSLFMLLSDVVVYDGGRPFVRILPSAVWPSRRKEPKGTL